MSSLTNGQVRKSLAEQIDRLEALLNHSTANLNEAVVAAVKDAVTVALQQAIANVLHELSNPEFVKLLRSVLTPPPPDGPTGPDEPRGGPMPGERPRGGVRPWLRRSWRACRAGFGWAREAAARVCCRAAGARLGDAVLVAAAVLAAVVYHAPWQLAAAAGRVWRCASDLATRVWGCLRALRPDVVLQGV